MSETKSMPPEAQRRGRADTLFSAPWFDDEAQEEQQGSGSSRARMLLVVVFLAMMLMGCGLTLLSAVGAAAYVLLG